MTRTLGSIARRARQALAGLGEAARRRAPILTRTPPLGDLLELAARIGYGARGFVYLSIGVVGLLAANEVLSMPVGGTGVADLIGNQPLGKVWLVLLGLGLWAFVVWRVLQSVFDVDHEGTSLKALGLRAGQFVSGLFYGVLGASVFELLDEIGETDADDVAEAQEQARRVLDLPFGDWLLIAVGLAILGMAAGNMLKGWRGEFKSDLACDAKTCRKVLPLARAGYVARGLAYLPLSLFVVMAGLTTRASEVRSFGASLAALESQPFGSLLLGLTALGLIAFGAFAFVEARWRRIRVPDNPVSDLTD